MEESLETSELIKINKVVEMYSTPVIESGKDIKNTMALTIHPQNPNTGVLRVITSRKGIAGQHGSVDRSLLYKVKKVDEDRYEIDKELNLSNQNEIITTLEDLTGWNFSDLEDPDIELDEEGKIHLYFTMVFKDSADRENYIFLGHAAGGNLEKLKMTKPVLSPESKVHWGAKEVSIAPKNSKGTRYNLVESSNKIGKTTYSVLRMAEVNNFGGNWEYKGIVLHPKNLPEWAAGHVSPGPMLSKDFVNVGNGKCVVFLNGREANKVVGRKIKYGHFTVGLMIYNYESGKVVWVSSEPLIKDPDAKSITFASEFIEQSDNGILYAHIDDSSVRKYVIDAKELKKWIESR